MSTQRPRPWALLGILAATLWTGATRADEPGPVLKVGDKVPIISAPAASDGKTVTVDYAKSKATLLLLFLPDCPHCQKMLPEWGRAFPRKSAGLNVVALMLGDEPPGFFNVFPIPFPVVRYPGKDAQAHFKMIRVPMMVRVDPKGTVTDVVHGVIDPIRVGEFFR
jgi:Redoxin